jgi:hypothetical protein
MCGIYPFINKLLTPNNNLLSSFWQATEWSWLARFYIGKAWHANLILAGDLDWTRMSPWPCQLLGIKHHTHCLWINQLGVEIAALVRQIVIGVDGSTTRCGYLFRIFDRRDHLHQWNVKRDHLWKYLPKKTPSEWRHPWPGDTWHVPPGPVPAGACRQCPRRHVAVPRSGNVPPVWSPAPWAARPFRCMRW